MKELCSKIVKKRGAMTEDRPCIREKNHSGEHIPDLTGMQFGNLVVIKRALDYVRKRQRRTRWKCKDLFGLTRSVDASSLLRGRMNGKNAAAGSGHGTYDKNGKQYPSYCSALRHIEWIVSSNYPRHKSYKNMKLHPEWDPRKTNLSIGQCAQRAMRWIQENIGERPSPDYQLHVIKKHERDSGFFSPKGIKWLPKIDRHQRMELAQAEAVFRNLPDKQFQALVSSELMRRAKSNGSAC
jgi:hypothetical protein